MAMIALLLALKTCEEPILEVNIVFITFDEQYVFKKRVFDVEKDVHYLNQSLRSKVKKDHSKSLEYPMLDTFVQSCSYFTTRFPVGKECAMIKFISQMLKEVLNLDWTNF